MHAEPPIRGEQNGQSLGGGPVTVDVRPQEQRIEVKWLHDGAKETRKAENVAVTPSERPRVTAICTRLRRRLRSQPYISPNRSTIRLSKSMMKRGSKHSVCIGIQSVPLFPRGCVVTEVGLRHIFVMRKS